MLLFVQTSLVNLTFSDNLEENARYHVPLLSGKKYYYTSRKQGFRG
jgi:hypothetical protein